MTHTNKPQTTLAFTLGRDIPVESLIRSGETATITTAEAHELATGNIVALEGVKEPGWKGDYAVTATGPKTLKIPVRGDLPERPTGTITINRGPLLPGALCGAKNGRA